MKQKDLLLVIDMQNVYLPGEEWACPKMNSALENIISVIGSGVADQVVFTKFEAPAKPEGCWKAYNQEYCDINESGYLNQLVESLGSVAEQYPVYEKSTYSSMRIPELRKMMKEYDRLVLTGVVAECCVLATMMEAIDDGIKVIYLEDCIAGQSEENESMIRKIAESFSSMHVQVMEKNDYLKGV